MNNRKTTLKDVAAALHVSTTTVHRALNGKAGISEQLRSVIQNKAAEMGYETNLAAAALKRKEIRIGVLLPEPLLENRYYYSALWSGIYSFTRSLDSFNVGIREFYYPLLPDSHGNALKNIYESHLHEIDGLITLGIDSSQSSYFVDKINQSKIPCIILGSDLYPHSRLCCVKAFDEMAGNLAAELFTAFLPQDFQGMILLTGNPIGSSAMIDQYHNLMGFESYLQQYFPSIHLRTAYCSDTGQLESLLMPFLSGKSELPYGIYASSARHTVKTCQIIEKHGLSGKIHIIGNDSFPESLDYLKKHVLTAAIDKKVSRQSYEAASILFEYLSVGHYPERDLIQIQPDIIMRSNLPPVF